MKPKVLALLLAAMLLCICGCSPLESVPLPERTPEPTLAPEPTVTPEPTPVPTPSPTPIPAPEDLEALSQMIGIDVHAPKEPIEGMALSSIGYDGEGCGALKYTSAESSDAYLLYTVAKGMAEPDSTFDSHFVITVNGLEVMTVKDPSSTDENTLFARAYWYKNSNTYQLLAEPALDTDTLMAAVSEMMSAAQNNNAPSVETQDAASLESVVGYPVPQPAYIPKGYSLSHIYALFGQLPVLIYSGESVELTFVKSEGIVHPPRFSRIEYASAGEHALPDGTKVSLYYTENGVSLAEWILDGYGYSITATDPNGNPVDLKKKEFLKLIDGFAEIKTQETE